MKMKHVVLEMYCFIENENNKPRFCEGIGHMCIQNSCEHMGSTYCPNEIAYANDKGIVEAINHWIGFGGDMESDDDNIEERAILLDEWKRISIQKIDEAYDEYMKFKNNYLKDKN